MIKFACPKGHLMRCPEDRAGRSGKCPECGTLFRVPKPKPKEKGAAADSKAGSAILQADELIEFYCPNEHYLQASARLAGTRGQCPHCNARFHIPAADEDHVEEGPVEAAEAAGEEDDDIRLPEADEEKTDVEEDAGEDAEEPAATGSSLDALDVPPPPPSSSGTGIDFGFVDQQVQSTGDVMYPPEHEHPMAALFERIWEESDREATIELHLSDGEILAPQHYAHDVSRGKYGVFGVKNRDETHQMTVVSWDNIARVTVRGLGELPPTMFD